MPTTTDEWGNVIEEHPGGQATFDGKTLQEHLAAGTLPKGWYLGLYGEPRAKFSGYSEGQTAIVNQGHFFAYVVGGEVKGEYYPGYSSSGRPAGGIGEIQPILDQIRAGQDVTSLNTSPDVANPEPKAVQDAQEKVTTAGYTKRWRKADGQIAVVPRWTWVGTDGEVGTPPASGTAPDVRVNLVNALSNLNGAVLAVLAQK